MHKYFSRSDGMYKYHNKKDLISDLCEELQKGKKEFLSQKSNPLFLNKSFELFDVKAPHLEWWDFTIEISDKFKVLNCVLSFCDEQCNLQKIKYCVDNTIFRNITEFREFLNREIYKEETQ
jgi:hypothetical protein